MRTARIASVLFISSAVLWGAVPISAQAGPDLPKPHIVNYTFDKEAGIIMMVSDETITVKDGERAVGDFNFCDQQRLARGLPRIEPSATPQVLACMTARLKDAARTIDLNWRETEEDADKICINYVPPAGHPTDLLACKVAEFKY